MHTATTFPPVNATTAEADSIFAALDQRLVGRGSDRWLALVTAVTSDGGDWWVQVCSTDQTTKVLLRASRWATTAQLVAALERYETSPGPHPPVIEVMRVHHPVKRSPAIVPATVAS